MNFVHLMIDYIEENGYIEDNSVLMQEPFRSVGSIVSIFEGSMNTARYIMDISNSIRENADVVIA